ncbi:MAG: hypothetical protein IRZ16_11325 [Myxococcaceae bacterium]|nr:hypothetical protein [Myxococcaceae bacterium]
MRNRALVVAATFAVVSSFTGCRDLTYREPEAENTPPVVAFTSPHDGDVLPLWWHVALSAEDADGLAAATLSCNGTVLFQWVRPPYEAELELSRCLPPNAAAAADVTLDAVVADGLGMVSAPVSVTVQVDPSLPKVVAQVPSRVAPGATVSFPMAAESPLGALPVVMVDGNPASVTGDAALQNFTVSFTAPAIAPPGGSSVEDFYLTEHQASVEIVAAAPNGNEVRLTRPLVVSRVLWERPIPGYLVSEAGRTDEQNFVPRSTPDGLWLALAPEGETGWTPAFLRADGTFVTPTLPSGATARGFSHDGRVLVDDPTGSQTLAVSPDGVTEAGAHLPDGALMRFSDKTCVQTWVSSGSCPLNSAGTFTCIPSSATPPPAFIFDRWTGGVAQHVVQSGETFLAFDFVDPLGFCVPDTFSFVTAGASTTDVGEWGVTGPSGAQVTRAIPFGTSGAFFVQEEGTGVRVEGGQPTATYPSLGKVPPGQILAGRDNGEVIVVTAANGHTNFSAVTPTNQTIPVQIPGTFPLAPWPELSGQADWTTPSNVVALPDGGFVYLAHPHPYGLAVVAIDANLQLEWVYPYPRPSYSGMLVHDVPESPLYLVDFTNSYVVALAPP